MLSLLDYSLVSFPLINLDLSSILTYTFKMTDETHLEAKKLRQVREFIIDELKNEYDFIKTQSKTSNFQGSTVGMSYCVVDMLQRILSLIEEEK